MDEVGSPTPGGRGLSPDATSWAARSWEDGSSPDSHLRSRNTTLDPASPRTTCWRSVWSKDSRSGESTSLGALRGPAGIGLADVSNGAVVRITVGQHKEPVAWMLPPVPILHTVASAQFALGFADRMLRK